MARTRSTAQGLPPAARAPSRGRILFTLAALVAVGTALAGRLLYLQVLQGPRFQRLARLERMARLSLLPPRGPILDRNRVPLAVDVTTYSVYADDFLIRHPKEEAALLSSPLQTPASTLARLLSQPRGFVWLARHLTYAQYRAARQLDLPGIFFTSEQHRRYPQGSLMEPALGFVGVDDQGLAGVEEFYNQALAGRPGREEVQVDALGNPLPSQRALVQPAVPGDTLVLTLDTTLQTFATRALDAAIRATRSRSGRILLLDPRSGEILAMAQYPVGNPAEFWRYPPQDFANQLVEDAYYPGSTFKPVTAAAGLLWHVFTPQSRWYDSGVKVITGVTLHGWEWPRKFGWLSFDQAVALSSDIAFWDIGLELGARRLEDFARRLSLLTRTGIDLPGESPGLWIPWRRAHPLDTAELAFGQGQVLTPVQLAAAIAAIADGGVWHRPHVGKELVTPGGRIIPLGSPGRRVMPAWVAAQVVHAMERVVTPQGTGALAAIPGYRLAGKTGTSQVIRSRQGFTGTYMASFVGFGPLPHPRLLALVQLDHPQGRFYGGDIAAPVFAQVMSAALHYLGVPPTRPSPPPRATVTVRVPSLAGRTVAYAVRRLLAAGYVPVLTGRGERVLGEHPSGGAFLPPGSSVTVVAGGGLTRRVPSLLGLTVREAAAVLSAEGLPGQIRGDGVVRRQVPAPGHTLLPGHKVVLVCRSVGP